MKCLLLRFAACITFLASLAFTSQAEVPPIYLIGAPQAWNIYDGSMPLEYKDNGYYGAYYIAEGTSYAEGMCPGFRFYSELGDWQRDTYGCQIDDSPVDYGALDAERKFDLVRGKGIFQFSEWPDGMMYMYVEGYYGYLYSVTLSPFPISAGCDDLPADSGADFRLEVGDGCVTVTSDGNAVIDFVSATGAVAKRVSVTAGTTTVDLTPGFYVVAGQKIFVR
ncbi:MAG TPA: hypothetical protein K8V47_00910 [Candidatus Amulumruptor caecigallinarius]|uniref:Uncharacterized protein n=1 Tax=Candidatus Amulumruptor caecigallinarius TaxID=2109911 RepID=A0A921E787_9BACT|nr:hypothetical protein [Candidatus Amulumruptor caecigallinarius]